MTLEPIEVITERFELTDRYYRAIALVRDRGADGAPAWVWDVIDAWDIA